MCGKFNEIIANFAIKNIDQLKVIRENRTIMTLGDRLAGTVGVKIKH